MLSAKHIAKRVRAAHEHTHCFTPARYLPVRIDPANAANPYAIAETVRYHDGVVNVEIEQGFQWDGASIPYWWPCIPWLVTTGLHYHTPSLMAWLVTVLLVLYTLRLLPWMQHMGRHARAACVHDWLYRTKQVSRPIADAIFLEIMRMDRVPIDIRWQIYANVRLFGWTAYNKAAVRTANVPESE